MLWDTAGEQLLSLQNQSGGGGNGENADFPVLQRDIAPGAAAQVDVLMDFWQADPHGSMEICFHRTR